MTLPLEGIKPGGNYPWAEYVKATLCDERHQVVELDPKNYFPDRVTTPS